MLYSWGIRGTVYISEIPIPGLDECSVAYWQIVEIGWTTKKKIEEQEKNRVKEKDGKVSLALFKARMAAEVDADTVEDKYITAAYVIMRKFKYTLNEILTMPASTFNILLEELKKQHEKEEAEMKKARHK